MKQNIETVYLNHKQKQNFQNGKLNQLKRIPVLRKIRTKVQLNSIRLEDLECLKRLFDAKEQGAIPFHLVQITVAFLEAGYTNEITSQEIHKNVYPFHFDNPKLTEYLESIWSEMFERQVQILIF